MMSISSPAFQSRLKAADAGACISLTLFSKPHFLMFWRMISAAWRSFSTIQTWDAPRLAASRPICPLPPKRSRNLVPLSSACRIEKMASLTRSPVGLVASPLGASSFSPLFSPAIILGIALPSSTADLSSNPLRLPREGTSGKGSAQAAYHTQRGLEPKPLQKLRVTFTQSGTNTLHGIPAQGTISFKGQINSLFNFCNQISIFIKV